jgi:predicted secreted Zn-dependent protease
MRSGHLGRASNVIVWLAAAFFAAALCTVGGTKGALAGPVVKETFDYYDVDGASAQEIRADLDRRGPIDGYEHRHFDAVTRWRVRWEYTYEPTATGCEIGTVSTAVDVTYSFPRLSANSAAPADVRHAFAHYLQRLLVHEKGHAQNGIDIAKRIENSIRALHAASSCDGLSAAANSLGRSLIKEANRLDIDYDARTEHGKTQGARFPQDDLPGGGGGHN